MSDKYKIIPLLVFVITFVIVISIFFIINNKGKDKYSCYDSLSGKTYTFKTEEEMHEVCDKLDLDEEDQKLESYPIYNDLIKEDNDDFAFYPYINDDDKLDIVIAISNCNNKETAKEKARKWFSEHSYYINDYNIEFEDPCDVE